LVEVLCTPVAQRKLYRDEHGSQNPQVRWGWDCPVTGERVGSSDEIEARKDMLAHDCGGAGWCPIPMTPERVALAGQPHLLEPTPEDRKRWAKARSKRKIVEK
jgi:hypothetical protein